MGDIGGGSDLPTAPPGRAEVAGPSSTRGRASGEYRPGSRADFDRLYQAVYQRVFRSLVALTGSVAAAEDCTQEAFLKAYQAWDTWNGEAPAEAWVHRIAINTAISYRRYQRLREVGEVVRRLGRRSDGGEDLDLGLDLGRELRRLPPKQAAIIVLRHLHGYTNREIAATLAIPESTVASRLFEAKKTLRARLRVSDEQLSDTFRSSRVTRSK